MEIKTIINRLSLEEKFALLTGRDSWRTVAVERLGIPAVVMADGPHGLRKTTTDLNGRETTLQATSFPTAAAMAATWNPQLVGEVGRALGAECGALEVDILLGPGVNIKRTPLCGRNFEYFSEDPFLAGELAVAYVNGVQSQGVGTSLKHFATNNQEFDRFQISSEVDLRTLREIYLKPFETVVRKAQPWTVMCAYNRLNGIYCSENQFLLSRLLRKEWGFQGIVVSDWNAVHDRTKSLLAGLELEMPFSGDSMANLRYAYKNGLITAADLDGALERLLSLIDRAVTARNRRVRKFDSTRHHALAKQAALEAITLLKNEDGILPIQRQFTKRIVVIGEFAVKPVIQGDGSSHVQPLTVDSPLECLRKLAGTEVEVTYFPVYSADKPLVNQLNHALAAVPSADRVIIFAGNRGGNMAEGRDGIESEGYDRSSLALSPEMERTILQAAARNPNTVVVIQAGAAVAMSAWIAKVKAVVYAWYSGQAGGAALADLLFGVANPSGKIAETFPIEIADTPAAATYPGNGFASWYSEGIMVGYRYYDTFGKEVLFPFGFGLSYTTFAYSDLRITPTGVVSANDPVTVSCRVKNTGAMEGKETVQLYIRDTTGKVLRPDKELKAFAKIDLQPGEAKEVRFQLSQDAFAYFNTSLDRWHVASGTYRILIGASSRDIRLEGSVTLLAEQDFS
jgi:beta-glucosidase